MKKIALIVAGGSGQRMGSTMPKQFLLLHGKPVLHYTIKAFREAFDDVQFILVLPAMHMQHADAIMQGFKNIHYKTTTGGVTRFHSVQKGLQLINKNEEAVIFIHDGVRCLLTADLIKRCYEQSLLKGSAIPAVTSTDSVRIVHDAEASAVIARENVKLIQTPQTFLSSIILPAYNQEHQQHFTDEATVAEACGNTVYLIEGEASNIKITRPIDLIIAAQMLAPSVF